MKANELRIGNLVQDIIGLETRLVVYKIGGGVITCGDEHFDYPYLAEDIKPIHLSSALLEACGFITNEWGYTHPVLKCRWVTTSTLTGEDRLMFPFLRLDSTGKPPYTSTDILYLHQLQNLYHALTGEELTIKEPLPTPYINSQG